MLAFAHRTSGTRFNKNWESEDVKITLRPAPTPITSIGPAP